MNLTISSLSRFSEMDRIRRRQIGARPFLRPAEFFVRITSDRIIPFDFAVVNEGNAMDLTYGIFTAPRPGNYFFSFTGHAQFPATSSYLELVVGLYLNGARIGWGYVSGQNTIQNQYSPLIVQSTLNLKKGDRIWVQIDFMSTGAYLYDSGNHFTHFTGSMLEEEIASSL
jgi:hypothetical protein